MKNIKAKNLCALICNLLLFVLVCISVARFFRGSGEGNMLMSGFKSFRYFTILSNVFAALLCLPAAYCAFKGFRSGSDALSRNALMMMYAGTSAVTLTLVVVLVFLGQVMGYAAMFVGVNFFLHLLCPLLAIASLTFFLGGGKLSRKNEFWGVLPALLYGTLYLMMVVILGEAKGGWDDFYHFNMNGLWCISYPTVILASWGLAALLRLAHNAFSKK